MTHKNQPSTQSLLLLVGKKTRENKTKQNKTKKLYLDGVGEGEGDNVAGGDAGGEQERGSVIDQLV
jgi:hypothetical protein